jgi:hypothetical protein
MYNVIQGDVYITKIKDDSNASKNPKIFPGDKVQIQSNNHYWNNQISMLICESNMITKYTLLAKIMSAICTDLCE